MAYRLSLDEPVAGGLIRILGDEIAYATGQLRDSDLSTRDERIHEARKSVKKMRAILRLIDAGESSNALLRETGRSLSAFRDAAALVETVDTLRERYTDEISATSLARLRRSLVRRQRAAERRQDPQFACLQAIAALGQFRRDMNAWPALPPDFEGIAPGWKRAYRRGRAALVEAKTNPSPETFHELRKAVKNHWYHIRLLENVWPETMSAREKCLKDLQEWLGDDHNLAVLRGGMGVAHKALLPMIDARQQELRGASLALAEKIYAERPRDHLRRFQVLWSRRG